MCAVCSLGVDAVIHCVSSYFIPSTTLGGRKRHPHFIDETTEASKCLSHFAKITQVAHKRQRV